MMKFTLVLFAILLVSSFASSEGISNEKQNISSQYKCKGTAQCINGTVTKIIDGDTLRVKEIVDGIKNYKIRLSLTSVPELKTKEGVEASNFLKKICPVGSKVIVDQDDKKPYDKYNRILGKIICNGENLEAKLLSGGHHAKIDKKFCKTSEFATEDWAQQYGCATKAIKSQTPKETPKSMNKGSQCDSSYPDVCISPYPPDLDCKGISYKNFRVLPPDPHGFDYDKNGIGCETK